MSGFSTFSWRENYLRTVEFRSPEYIPCRVVITLPVWRVYRGRLEELASRHPMVFQEFKPPEEYRGKGAPKVVRDPYGCVWRFVIEGYQGQVVKHPLKDWKTLKDYQLPDPEDGVISEGSHEVTPWIVIFKRLDEARSRGDLVVANMPHGFFFQRLYYLRGFVNLMKDFLAKPPELYRLIEMLTEYNLKLVKMFLKSGRIDVFYFGDDLGVQDRMTISPRAFRDFIYPSYRKIFQVVRGRGAHVYFHTDGHVIEIVDQLIEAGVDILNVQDRVNGLENIASKCKGRVCVDLDIDRQYLIPFGTPGEIKAHIKRAVETLTLRTGGLMMKAEVHPPTPLVNVEALAQAMEEYMKL